jgi:hypothetical protein
MKLLSLLLIGLILTSCSLNPTPLLPLKGSAAATATAASGASTNATQQAVRAVIQRANAEQVEALTRNDPSAMQDTSTASYYQQSVQVNQDLAANGVSAIKLIALEWGPMTVRNPNTVQATTFESWQTTFADGHTDVQNHDRNVYTLVKENGSWKIQADDHPDDQLNQSGGGTPVPGSSVSTPVPVSSPLPTLTGLSRNESQNWSGYAATGGKFTAINGTWTVPQVSAAATTTGTSRRGPSGFGDATWVGVGGVSGRDLIQAGTEASVVGPGHAVYDAWVEMLPEASQTVPLTVSPGDSITIAIDEDSQGSGSWSVSYVNNTTGQKYQTNVQYASSESSAEWIEEAPSGGRRLVPLDNFGTVRFSGGSTVENGKKVNVAQAGAYPITMIDRSRQPLAVPSGLGSDGATFSVSRS